MNECTDNSQIFDLLQDNEVDVSTASTSTSATTSFRSHENGHHQHEATDCWSIDDDPFFQPLGLVAHGSNAGKCAFVTWSYNYLLNFVFKTSTRTNRPKMTKVRLSIDVSDEISDVLITELNTLVLMRSGRIHYFISMKCVQPIDWLSSGVRCISSSMAGFSLIRLHGENLLSLDIYRDVACVGKRKSTLLQCYDITFDSNLFDCPWLDEHFTLYSQPIRTAQHVEFMQHVIGHACHLRADQEVHFFTVSGHVFALITEVGAEADVVNELADPPDFTIQLLSSYASNVAFMRVLLEHNMCLVFLECGSIDMWYMSSQINILRRKTHHTGAAYTHYCYDNDTNCFYYTDERCVAQLRFTYDALKDTCHVRENIKMVPGIVAVTWAPSLQQLVCLSCNNFFYRITFESDDSAGDSNKQSTTGSMNCDKSSTEFEDLNQLYEMTTARVTQLLQKAHKLQELTAAPQILHKAIEQQYAKRQLISVAHKAHLYKRVCKAHVEYCTELPTMHANDTKLLYTKVSWTVQTETVYAAIRLSIADSNNAVFQTVNWQLQVLQSNGVAHLFQLTKDALHVPLCIVVPLTPSRYEALPEFVLNLLTLLGDANDNEYLAITLPIEVQTTAQSYAQLLSHTVRKLSTNYIELSVRRLIETFNIIHPNSSVNKHTALAKQQNTIKCLLRLNDYNTYDRIMGIFKVPASSLHGEHKQFPLYFMTSTLQLSCPCIDQQYYLQLESNDPVALYYVKLYLSKCLAHQQTMNTNTQQQPKQADARNVQQFHEFVKRTYKMLMHSQDENSTQHPIQDQHDLQHIYAKLRSGYAFNA